jgi:hypothetical protein
VSLSQEPAFSLLKKYFVCGYHDITNEPYAGVSGVHEANGNAVDTTNGAGPHNLQLFFLTADGTILNVLPGYWHSQDLVPEMNLAAKLNKVWQDPHLSRTQKDQLFAQMQVEHISEHSPQMRRRSRMQGFDMQYEAQHRAATSDTIADRQAVYQAMQAGMKMPPPAAFKTTDEIMHERLAAHPFEQYGQFNVAAFADYGKPKYDKHEDYRDASGQIDKMAAKGAPLIGSQESIQKADPGYRRRMQRMQQMYTPGQWGNGGSSGRVWGQQEQQY